MGGQETELVISSNDFSGLLNVRSLRRCRVESMSLLRCSPSTANEYVDISKRTRHHLHLQQSQFQNSKVRWCAAPYTFESQRWRAPHVPQRRVIGMTWESQCHLMCPSHFSSNVGPQLTSVLINLTCRHAGEETRYPRFILDKQQHRHCKLSPCWHSQNYNRASLTRIPIILSRQSEENRFQDYVCEIHLR